MIVLGDWLAEPAFDRQVALTMTSSALHIAGRDTPPSDEERTTRNWGGGDTPFSPFFPGEPGGPWGPVAPAGPLGLANRLVANDERAAGLEVLLGGLRLRASVRSGPRCRDKFPSTGGLQKLTVQSRR